jgi:DNA (cytosine-5)-methyltransferase 1
MSGIPVIDIFAGPGGLSEGFASLTKANKRSFEVRLSIEKDVIAHQTLSLRALFRSFPVGRVPSAYYEYIRREITRDQLERHPDVEPYISQAYSEARCAELGPDSEKEIDEWIQTSLTGVEDWVLIGGPPCQAYSLAGRSRMRGVNPKGFEYDERHFLYREYLRILKKFSPTVFVMENVKGILTSRHDGSYIFNKIIQDLKNPRDGQYYEIRSFVVPGVIKKSEDYIIKSEDYGIPQARHRVILFGIRSDVLKFLPDKFNNSDKYILKKSKEIRVGEMLSDLPPLRSKLSNRKNSRVDSFANWHQVINDGLKMLGEKKNNVSLGVLAHAKLANIRAINHEHTGGEFINGNFLMKHPLKTWYQDPRIRGVIQHETRSHMESDLHRYLFASSFALEKQRSPTLNDFPRCLLPEHENVNRASAPFSDRFRVQLGNQPSTTIVSHISKDGHYYIHPDPSQCRSLTVREAARLQTFPDNYFFEGNRTQQYHQVGNAVPPLLAYKIAKIVFKILKSKSAST